jgi:hypothetical protein
MVDQIFNARGYRVVYIVKKCLMIPMGLETAISVTEVSALIQESPH